jgi:hypothetical protein
VQQPDEVVGALGPEDLPMAGVVADESKLGEHHRQHDGDPELPPRVAQQDEHDPRAQEQAPDGHDLRQVVARPAVEQTGVPDPRQQVGKVTAMPGDVGGALVHEMGCCPHGLPPASAS